jgi:hypothetical protein
MTSIADGARESLLRNSLDALGLQYAVRRADDGEPYAAFRYEAGRREIHVRAQLLGRTLRFRAGPIIAPPVDDRELRLANEINLRWRTGRLDAAQGWSLTTWAYGAADRFATAAVQGAFEVLVDAAGRLVDFPNARFADVAGASPAYDDETRAQSMLALVDDDLARWPSAAFGSARTLDRVAAALGRHADHFHRTADGQVLTARFLVAGERDFLVDLIDPDGSTLFLRARHDRSFRVAATRDTWLALQPLNERFALGAAVVDEGYAQYHLSLPVAWTPIDDDLVEWLVSRSHASMQAIERAHLPEER